MSPVERVLHELRKALGGRLPPAIKEARLREMRGHLQMATVELGETAAVRRFGSPRLVANELVRAHRGYPTAGAGRLAFGAGAFMSLTIFLPYAYMQVSLGRPEELDRAIWWVERSPTVGLLVFLGRAVQTRRWLVVPGVLWTTAACAAILGISVGLNPTIDARVLPVVRENTRKEIALWTERAAGVAAWRRGGFPLRAPHLERVEGTAHYGFATFPTSEDYLGERLAQSRQAAKAEWEANGAAWAREVPNRLQEAKANLATLPRMFSTMPIQWGRLTGMVASGTIRSVAFLFAANGLTLGVCALNDRRRMRRA